MKQFKLCLLFIFMSSFAFAQTTPWSSTPTVTTQSRLFGGVFQVRDINNAHLFSWPDTLAKLIGKIPVFNNGIGSYGSYIGLGNNPLQQNTYLNINNHSFTIIDSANANNYFRWRNSDGFTGIWDDGSEGVNVNFNPGSIDLIAALDDNTGRAEFTGTTSRLYTQFYNQGTGQTVSINQDNTGISFVNTFTYKLPHVDPSLDIVDGGSLLTKHKADSLYSAAGSSVNIGNSDLTIVGGNRTLSTGTNNFIVSDGGYNGLFILPSSSTSFLSGGTSLASGVITTSNLQSAIVYNNSTFGGVASGLTFSPTAITLTDPLGHGVLGAADYSGYTNPLAYVQQKWVTNNFAPIVSGGYVPYTGAISDVNLGTHGVIVNAQSSTPSPPSANTNYIYGNVSGIVTFMGHNGFGLSLGKGHLTASHKLEAQNKDYTIADSAVVANSTSYANGTRNLLVTDLGDSMTAGYGGPPGWIADLQSTLSIFGFAFNNTGVGGQTSTQIAVRAGAVSSTATVVGGSIPASGGVTVTFPTGYEPVTSQGPVTGTYGSISSVPGLVTLSGSTYTFTRTTAGSSLSVTSAPFIVTPPYLGGPVTIWVGRNNFSNPTQVLSDISAIITELGSNTNYIIYTILNATSEPVGTTNYNQIISLNNSIIATYPGHAFDLRSYLVKATGSDPTGIINTAYKFDDVHLNPAGYALVAQYTQSDSVSKALFGISNGGVLTTNNLNGWFNNNAIQGQPGITSFTGTTPLGLRLSGSTTSNQYEGIDFMNTYSSTPTIPIARIGIIPSASGSILSMGTSNSYGNGITNQAFNIDQNGNASVGATFLNGVKFSVSPITTSATNQSYTAFGNSTLLGATVGSNVYMHEFQANNTVSNTDRMMFGFGRTIAGTGYQGTEGFIQAAADNSFTTGTAAKMGIGFDASGNGVIRLLSNGTVYESVTNTGVTFPAGTVALQGTTTFGISGGVSYAGFKRPSDGTVAGFVGFNRASTTTTTDFQVGCTSGGGTVSILAAGAIPATFSSTGMALPLLTTAGVLHNAATTGVLSSSLIQTADLATSLTITTPTITTPTISVPKIGAPGTANYISILRPSDGSATGVLGFNPASTSTPSDFQVGATSGGTTVSILTGPSIIPGVFSSSGFSLSKMQSGTGGTDSVVVHNSSTGLMKLLSPTYYTTQSGYASATVTETNKTLTSPQINTPLLNTTSVAGQVWTASNTTGAGGWVTPASGNILASGQVSLSAGVSVITVSGVTTSSKAYESFVAIGGTVSTTWQYKCVCTANTITITAITNAGTTDTTDTSTLNWNVIQ